MREAVRRGEAAVAAAPTAPGDGRPGGDDGRRRTPAVSNLETGTSLDVMGLKIHQRTTLSAIADDGFLLEQEQTFDGGQNWSLAAKMTYTRRGD